MEEGLSTLAVNSLSLPVEDRANSGLAGPCLLPSLGKLEAEF
jgi:hypothetical protein